MKCYIEVKQIKRWIDSDQTAIDSVILVNNVM